MFCILIDLISGPLLCPPLDAPPDQLNGQCEQRCRAQHLKSCCGFKGPAPFLRSEHGQAGTGYQQGQSVSKSRAFRLVLGNPTAFSFCNISRFPPNKENAPKPYGSGALKTRYHPVSAGFPALGAADNDASRPALLSFRRNAPGPVLPCAPTDSHRPSALLRRASRVFSPSKRLMVIF